MVMITPKMLEMERHLRAARMDTRPRLLFPDKQTFTRQGSMS
jgi:hypothetical protein